MKVINRKGESVDVHFDAIKTRIQALCSEEEARELDIDTVVIQTVQGIHDGITTTELDQLSARVCAGMQATHYLYGDLAGKILVSDLHKNLKYVYADGDRGTEGSTFSSRMTNVWRKVGTLSDAFVKYIVEHGDALDAMLVPARDYTYSYFAFRTLERSYLLRDAEGRLLETPQDMIMRVAVAVHMDFMHVDAAMARIRETYELMSTGMFTHATPTLFNAGTEYENMVSCYLLGTEDSMGGIYKTLADCAQISKWAGGIGVHVSNVRARGAKIKSTNGTADGLVPMLKVYNETARYCNQAGRRKGSIAIYLEPWHADVWEFCELRRNSGAETERARDLFLALWVPDLFMEAVRDDADWHLMTPDVCPGLNELYGDKFKEAYETYVSQGKFVRRIRARDLWYHIMDSQIETGTPYILFKDHVNRKSNHANVGIIKSSNLCVAPETQILTADGYRVISELKDQEADVWNGERFSRVTVRQTGVDQPLLTVWFSNGEALDCTPYHKFYIQGRDGLVEAKDLQPGMQVRKFAMPLADDSRLCDDLVFPESHGRFCAEEVRTGAKGCAVPARQKLSIKLRWLEGLVDGAGILTRDGDIRIDGSDASRTFLHDTKRMMDTVGVDAEVLDAHGVVTLRFCARSVAKLAAMGFAPKSSCDLSSLPEITEDTEDVAICVTSVDDAGRRADTYCFTEPLAQAGVFNGIRTSQCAEITEYSDSTTYACCNLASIAVNRFVTRSEDGTQQVIIDHARLHDVTKVVVRNLDRIIDNNYYPTKEARSSNLALRPVGVGIQGMGDLYCLLGQPYDSEAAVRTDAEVMETIYHAAIEASVEMAQQRGPYPCFRGSPFSCGRLQIDAWPEKDVLLSGRYDWDALRQLVRQHGTRNSLLTALMPTASTSQIMGNAECFEPINSNLFKRGTLAGEFLVVNRHLMRQLMDLGLWSAQLKDRLLLSDGSIQSFEDIPEDVRRLYRTVWELPQRSIIDHAAARGPFVDQSQSMNLYFATPNYTRLHSALMYAWQRGLKTGVYYVRSKPAKEAIKFAVSAATATAAGATASDAPTCTMSEGCVMCSS